MTGFRALVCPDSARLRDEFQAIGFDDRIEPHDRLIGGHFENLQDLFVLWRSEVTFQIAARSPLLYKDQLIRIL